MNLTQKQIAELHEGSVTPHGYINELDYRGKQVSRSRKRIMKGRQEYGHTADKNNGTNR